LESARKFKLKIATFILFSDILKICEHAMFKVKIGPNYSFKFSEYLKKKFKSMNMVQNFALIPIKQELSNSEHVAQSYDYLVVLFFL